MTILVARSRRWSTLIDIHEFEVKHYLKWFYQIFLKFQLLPLI